MSCRCRFTQRDSTITSSFKNKIELCTPSSRQGDKQQTCFASQEEARPARCATSEGYYEAIGSKEESEQMSMGDLPEMVREPLDELDEELQTVASLVHLSIKNQQQQQRQRYRGGKARDDDGDLVGAFDCSGDAERRFQVLYCTELDTYRSAANFKSGCCYTVLGKTER